MLFGSVALVGLLGASVHNLVIGPATTVSKVTQQNMTQNDLLMNAKVVVMHASTLPQMGDEDGDGYVEPVAFVPTSAPSCNITLPGEGGCLPADIGAVQTDPWGTQYAYCVWDHGDPRRSANRIDGEDSTSGAVLAIISAGPNKRFETPCSAYDGDPDTNDEAINPNGVGDDLVQIYTYAAAVAGSGGLWELKLNEPETAVIDKKLEIGDVDAGTGFAFDTQTGTGEFPYVKTDFLASKSGGSTPVTMDSNIALDGRWLSGDGGNEGVYVAPNGNVNIGTPSEFIESENARLAIHSNSTNPSFVISVNNGGGNAGFWGHVTDAGAKAVNYLRTVDTDNPANAHYWYMISDGADGNKLKIGQNAGFGPANFTIQKDGKVGIGTTNPSTALDVSSSYPVISIRDTNNTVSENALAGIVLFKDSAGTQYGWVGNGSSTDNRMRLADVRSDGSIALWVNGSDRVVVTADGNVGIGISDPQQELHVSNGNVSGGGNQTVAQFGSGSGSLFLTHSTAHVSGNLRYDDGRWRYEGNGGGSAISFGNGYILLQTAPVGTAGAVATLSKKMLVTETGKVGIGTITPQSNLHIVSSENPSNLMLGELNTGTETSAVPVENAQLILSGRHNQGYNGHSAPLAVKLWIGSYDNDGTIVYPIYVEDENNSPDFWIRNKPSASGISTAYFQGDVGIGTMSPSHRLHVNGIARSTQASFATSSDLRVKEDIEPLAEGLDTVMRLNPVHFHYKHDYAEGKQGMDGLKRGFIAQEVEAVVPEMVTQTEEVIADGSTIDDFRILNNGDFTPILVKAVQELKAENDALRAELQAANDNFRRELEELKAAIGK